MLLFLHPTLEIQTHRQLTEKANPISFAQNENNNDKDVDPHKKTSKTQPELSENGREELLYLKNKKRVPEKYPILLMGAREDEHTELRWEISRPERISKYELQHSTDKEAFSPLNSLPANTNAAAYLFIHYAPPRRTNHYRVKVTDKGGQTSYSNVLTLQYKPSYSLQVDLDSFDGSQILVAFRAKAGGEAQIQLVDQRDYILFKESYEVPTTSSIKKTLQFNQALSKQTYLLELWVDGKRHEVVELSVN